MLSQKKYKKIVVASDSFKGTLTSQQIADICREVIGHISPGTEVVGVEVADGGEGTVVAIARSLGASPVELPVTGPLRESVTARYAITTGGVAVIEMAAACGLPLVPPARRSPLVTTTEGVGMMIADAITRGATRVILGLGGTATCDAGMGMLTALGFRFRDANGVALPGCGASLGRVALIDSSALLPGVADCRYTLACDVDSPLLGPAGAACRFAPQKGADTAMVHQLEKGMKHFAQLLPADIVTTPGTGAAGGVGATMATLLHADLRPGVELILDTIGFDRIIADADLVITGEGHVDRQSLGGKTPAGVIAAARRHGIPVLLLAGAVSDLPLLSAAGFPQPFSINDGFPDAGSDAANPLDPAVAARRLADTIVTLLPAL